NSEGAIKVDSAFFVVKNHFALWMKREMVRMVQNKGKENTNYIRGRDFINLPSMEGCRVLTGEESLNNKIQGANVIEVPDIIDWLRPADVLITTAFPFRDDLSQLVNLLEQFAEKGIAGIAIKPKRYIDTITKDMIDKANEVGIFVIELHANAVFSDIVFETIQAISYKSMNTYWKVQEQTDRLLSELSNTTTIEDMLTTLCKELKRNLMIVDNSYKKIYAKEYWNTTDNEEKKQGYWNQQSYEKQEYSENEIEELLVLARDNIETKKYYIIPFYQKENHSIYMLIHQEKQALSTIERKVIENIIPIISLQIRNSNLLKKQLNQYRDRFLLDWLKGAIIDKLDIVLFAKEFGISLNAEGKYQVAIVSFRGKENDKTIKEQMSRMQYHFYRLKVKFLIAVDGGEVIIIMESTQEEVPQIVLQKLLQELRIELGENLVVILSNPQPINLVSVAYREVKKMKEISFKCRVKGDIIRYSDLGIYTILSLIPNHPEVHSYIKRFVEPIREYDVKNNTKLLETLITYYELGGNAKEASKHLYIHYNTMMYRLDKVKNILEIDIDHVETKLQLQIALKLDAIEYKENANGRNN
uniref:PucR family transcriptional regulator n=1 Tax=Anaerosporobacter sp. TaxID=1872529 RepID=UPI00286EEACB